ncbi:hypothetical protein KBC99_00245 [Candidatus Saccharibacteria bacterium]|nr:hypothetical protein [Candidatus Saccharibacteria bacterium]
MNPAGYVDVKRIEFMATLSPFFTPNEMEFIEAAYFFSKNAHREQYRDDGTRYFEHPKTVAWLLAIHFGVHDYKTICIALLHDMLEDSFIMTPRFIKRAFNREIMFGCKIMSKNDFDKAVVGDIDAAYYARFCTDANWRVLMAKLVDRIHNLSTMDDMDPVRVARKVDETELYFPALQAKLLEITPAQRYEAAQAITDALDDEIADRNQWLAKQTA